MSKETTATCANCEQLQRQVETLRQLVEQQQQSIASLTAQVGILQEKLAAAAKDSSTSSKPPSSDIVKPPKPAPPPGQGKRQRGGQPGHPKHQRTAFPPEQLTVPPHDYCLHCCPVCQGDLLPTDAAPRVVQQIDIRDVPLVIEEHRGHAAWCPACQVVHYAPLPNFVQQGGLAGPRLTTLIAYLKGACHASFSTIRKYLRDVVQVSISRGQLAKIIAKVCAALDDPYEELLKDLRKQPRLNVDETGHKQNGDRMWTWCFRAKLYTLFKIDPTRSGDVLIEVLGKEFDGVLGCDYFSSYRRYMRECDITLQFCLAHLIRDVKYLTTLPDWRDRVYGEALSGALRGLFRVIHRCGELTEEEFQQQLTQARQRVLSVGLLDADTQASKAIAQRFAEHGESYFVFITTPGVEPTNNLAEQAIRFVVIDRHITQGTRSETGNRWCERIWSVIATCTQQGRSVFAFLYQAVQAYFHEGAAPSLLPTES
jgi:transposase